MGNSYATGDLFAIGNVTSTGNMAINGGIGLNGGITINSANITTQTNDANQVIYEIPQNSFSTIRFQISSSAIDTNNSQTATITASKRNDGIRAQHNIFGTIFIGNAITRYNVDIAYGNLRLMVSPIPNIPMIHLFSYQSDKEV